MEVVCPCPDVCNDVLTPRHLFFKCSIEVLFLTLNSGFLLPIFYLPWFSLFCDSSSNISCIEIIVMDGIVELLILSCSVVRLRSHCMLINVMPLSYSRFGSGDHVIPMF